jgi:hypothetical protein
MWPHRGPAAQPHDEIDAQIAELQAILAELARMVDDYPDADCPDTAIGQWWYEQEFTERGRR